MDPAVREVGSNNTSNFNSQPSPVTSLRPRRNVKDEMKIRRLLISLLKAPRRGGRHRIAFLAATLLVSAVLLLWLLLSPEIAGSHMTTHRAASKHDSASQRDAVTHRASHREMVERRDGERAGLNEEARKLLLALFHDDSDAPHGPTDDMGDVPVAATDDKGREPLVSLDGQGYAPSAHVDDENDSITHAMSRQDEERRHSRPGDGLTTPPVADSRFDARAEPGLSRPAGVSPPQADVAVVSASSIAYSDESIITGNVVTETTMRHANKALSLEASSQTSHEASSPLTPEASSQTAHEVSSPLTPETSSEIAHDASSPLTPEASSQTAVPAESATTSNSSERFVGAVTNEATTTQSTTDDVATVYIGFSDPFARLGNKMFQYASGLSLALRYDRPAVLVHPESQSARALGDMRRVFRMSPLPVLLGPPPSTAINLVESGWGRYDAARFDSASTFDKSVYTVGYLQSWKYFAPVADRVRREFALTADAERAADSYFRSVGVPLLSEGSSSGGGEVRHVRVGVHVRRGDMLRMSHLYTVAPAEYLIKAIEHYRHKYAEPHYNVSFVFATDDQAWVHDLVASRLPRELLVHYVSLDAGGDMAVLSRCDHSIVTGGTFGWWAAWLAGGDVVYYKDFIRPESPLYAGHDPADYYPPSWLGLTD